MSEQPDLQDRMQMVLPPNKLAFVIDGKVVDILHTDERLAAIFLSNPLVLDVTGEDGEPIAHVNDTFNSDLKQFERIEIVEGQIEQTIVIPYTKD